MNCKWQRKGAIESPSHEITREESKYPEKKVRCISTWRFACRHLFMRSFSFVHCLIAFFWGRVALPFCLAALGHIGRGLVTASALGLVRGGTP